MYCLLKKEAIEKIFVKAIKKAGSMKLLSSKLEIPKSMLYRYLNRKIIINEERLNKILEYADINMETAMISETLPDNWKQVKGGENCVRLRKERGTYNGQMKLCHEGSSRYMIKLHKEMKVNEPKKYYLSQYKKFKKIGGYKFTTENGEKVRNELEKNTADSLKSLNAKYEYEPYVNIGGKAFFPDFLINNNVIIECTAWRGYDKAIKLKEKIKHLSKRYKVFVLIPEKLRRYYQGINENLIFNVSDLKIKS